LARFVIDANMPRATASLLNAAGHDAVDVRDIGIVKPDEAIVSYALSENRTIVTRDVGFGELARNQRSHPGLILLRVGGLLTEAIHACLLDGLRELGSEPNDFCATASSSLSLAV
jgi:predicted nuclease of predicted toxin-antitoxin system